MFHSFRRLLLAFSCIFFASSVFATTYPITVTDLSGAEVTIDQEPERIVIQDGRDLLTLALLDRKNPFERVVAWNNMLKRNDAGLWKRLETSFPDANKPVDMKFGDGGEVNLEEIIAKRPQLLVAELRAKMALEQAGVLETLKKVNVPVIFLDLASHPVIDAPKSVTLLGEVLNREQEAKEYTDFYAQQLKIVDDTIAKAHADGIPAPKVFIEAHAGISGAHDCCSTHSTFGWGGLVTAAGGDNIGTKLFTTPTAIVAMEKVIKENPDVYVVTGSQWNRKGSIALPLGYDVSASDIQSSFSQLMARSGFSDLKALKDGRIYGIYHQFYNHPYNIVAIEALAKDFYPKQFENIDPAKTYAEILTRFTGIDAKGLTLFAQIQQNK